MAVSATHKTLCSFLLTLLIFASVLARDDDDHDFSVRLIHRHSSDSPYYNPSETLFHSLKNALKRSANRLNHLRRRPVSPHWARSALTNDYGDYLMRLAIGTPPVEVLATVDTCSDLVWIQCRPCFGCVNQRNALFDTRFSSSYRTLSCDSRPCKSLHRRHRSCESHVCHYSYSYGDDCHIEGDLAKETVAIDTTEGDHVTFSRTTIGCGTYSSGNFYDAGVIGLGRGRVSLISRMKDSIHGRFSYCLVPYFSNAASRMHFGRRSVVSGSEVSRCKLASGDSDTYYYLTLEAVSVNNHRLTYCKKCVSSGDGNIILDIGTTITYLPYRFYDRLESRVRESIDLNPVRDPTQQLGLCYRAATHFRIPVITMHFANASVELDSLNTFIRVSEGVVCFAFAPTDDDIAVYGNWQQMNFLIGYELNRKRVSFKRTDCSNY
ncbi:hypothetical protein JCGZ_02616 [Jatropha curcas]|uniref:Peptidase A1 domain-containing protein n=1 Tax=Jatropha curcas TaxID=180498 RepID=A0A067KTP6_JATCU|nr:aspartic proteinase CDR1 [Jatropha curcas]KDP39596.1 hypothetical protein JCGZ_02616 [Jatropha curcas]